jgi:glutamine---fructose-6-phosphate transaminase (isomerizing)
LVEALKRLEYRGYDSAGIATVNAGKLDRRRAVGKLVNLSDLLVHDPLGRKGRHRPHPLGHPWRGHGHQRPPASVRAGRRRPQRHHRELSRASRNLPPTAMSRNPRPTPKPSPSSSTRDGPRRLPVDAARDTLSRLHGAFALCFLFDGQDDLMIAARKGSPLAIGWGDGEMFVGSDAIALAPMTDRVTYLEEGDWAVITRKGRRDLRRPGTAAPTGPKPASSWMPPGSKRPATSTSWPRKSPSSRWSSPTR